MMLPKLPKLPNTETPKFISENAELLSGLFFLSVAVFFGLLIYSAFKLIDAIAEK